MYVKKPPNSGLEEFIVPQVKLMCNHNKCVLINAIVTDVYLGIRMDESWVKERVELSGGSCKDTCP